MSETGRQRNSAAGEVHLFLPRTVTAEPIVVRLTAADRSEQVVLSIDPTDNWRVAMHEDGRGVSRGNARATNASYLTQHGYETGVALRFELPAEAMNGTALQVSTPKQGVIGDGGLRAPSSLIVGTAIRMTMPHGGPTLVVRKEPYDKSSRFGYDIHPTDTHKSTNFDKSVLGANILGIAKAMHRDGHVSYALNRVEHQAFRNLRRGSDAWASPRHIETILRQKVRPRAKADMQGTVKTSFETYEDLLIAVGLIPNNWRAREATWVIGGLAVSAIALRAGSLGHFWSGGTSPGQHVVGSRHAQRQVDQAAHRARNDLAKYMYRLRDPETMYRLSANFNRPLVIGAVEEAGQRTRATTVVQSPPKTPDIAPPAPEPVVPDTVVRVLHGFGDEALEAPDIRFAIMTPEGARVSAAVAPDTFRMLRPGGTWRGVGTTARVSGNARIGWVQIYVNGEPLLPEVAPLRPGSEAVFATSDVRSVQRDAVDHYEETRQETRARFDDAVAAMNSGLGTDGQRLLSALEQESRGMHPSAYRRGYLMGTNHLGQLYGQVRPDLQSRNLLSQQADSENPSHEDLFVVQTVVAGALAAGATNDRHKKKWSSVFDACVDEYTRRSLIGQGATMSDELAEHALDTLLPPNVAARTIGLAREMFETVRGFE